MKYLGIAIAASPLVAVFAVVTFIHGFAFSALVAALAALIVGLVMCGLALAFR